MMIMMISIYLFFQFYFSNNVYDCSKQLLFSYIGNFFSFNNKIKVKILQTGIDNIFWSFPQHENISLFERKKTKSQKKKKGSGRCCIKNSPIN